jgi:hypothetical protein
MNKRAEDMKLHSEPPYDFKHAEWAIYSSGLFVFCIVVGLLLVAQVLPPWSQASASPEEIAAFYMDENLRKKIGLSIAMFGMPFIIAEFVLMGEIIRRAMGMPILASVQLACGIFGAAFTFLMITCWGLAAFRPERMPEITQALHDGAWLVGTWVASATLLQVISILIAVLRDPRPEPLFPRWFPYFNMIAIPLGLGACVVNIFTQGPFAYDGLLGFWLPYAVLFAWFAAMMVALMHVVRKLQAEAQPARR